MDLRRDWPNEIVRGDLGDIISLFIDEVEGDLESLPRALEKDHFFDGVLCVLEEEVVGVVG